MHHLPAFYIPDTRSEHYQSSLSSIGCRSSSIYSEYMYLPASDLVRSGQQASIDTEVCFLMFPMTELNFEPVEMVQVISRVAK